MPILFNLYSFSTEAILPFLRQTPKNVFFFLLPPEIFKFWIIKNGMYFRSKKMSKTKKNKAITLTLIKD